MWEEVSAGENIDSDDESENEDKNAKDVKEKHGFGGNDSDDDDDDILVKVSEEKQTLIPEPVEVKNDKPFVPSKIKKKDIGKTR